MTILVTGGTGYIGSHLGLQLLEDDEQFIVLDNLSTGKRETVPASVPFYEGDIEDTALVGKILKEHKVDAIMHFAGSIIVPESVKDPLKYYHNNTAKTRVLLECAVKNNVKKFIFSSTAAVYGIPSATPAKETESKNPISPYGTSKLMTEMMLTDVSKAYDMSFVALRYFNVAGADPLGRTGQCTPNATHLIKVACQAALGIRPEVQVFGTDYPTSDGTGIRDYIHVSDLAYVHKLALDYLRNGGESKIMNCGYGRGYSVLEILDTMKKVSGVDFQVREVERRAGDPAELVADVSEVKKILNWIPKYDDLDLINKHALDWEKKLLEGAF